MSTFLASSASLDVVYLSRTDWGARTDLGRLGYGVARRRRTEVHIHHTAAIDTSDDTPNTWDLEHALRYQQRLQTVRPDLGLDVPYNFVAYIGEDSHTVWIMEGRGLDFSGAHTKGHNTAGIAVSFGGNFDLPVDPDDLARGVAAVRWFLTLLRTEYRLTALGTVTSPKGWPVWGHRDSSRKSCPGNNLYPLLEGMTLDYQEPDDMVIIKHGDSGNVVAKMQQGLNRHRQIHAPKAVQLKQDGVFGDATKARLIQFQQGAGIDGLQGYRPGVCDSTTMALLMEYVPDWYDKPRGATAPPLKTTTIDVVTGYAES